MKKGKSLSQLLDQARNAAPDAPAGKIQSLLEHGKALPLASTPVFRPRRINKLFNPLKLIVMISPIAIITSALLIWNPGHRKETIAASETDPIIEQAIAIRESVKSTVEPKTTPIPIKNDSILQGVFLELSNEELTRLGFQFTPTGFSFLNRMKDGLYLSFFSDKNKYTTHVYLDVTEDVHYMIKKDTTSLDFYPEAISDQQGSLWYCATKESKRLIDKEKAEYKVVWESMNDTLVPVKINSELTGGYDATPIILWFKASETFFSIIGAEKSSESKKIWKAAKAWSLSGGSANHVAYTYESYEEPDNLLVLSPDVFRCFGFYFEDGLYTFYSFINNIWFRCNPMSKGGEYIFRETPTNPDFLGISTPVLSIHNKFNGRMYVMNINLIYEIYRQDSVEGVPFMDALELCIPIKINDTTLDQHVQDCIFWIYPNDRFLQCLPPEIGEGMRKERNYQLKRMDPLFIQKVSETISTKNGDRPMLTVNPGNPTGGVEQGELKDQATENTEPIPCVYFTNLCQTMSGLDYVNLYPNPATDKLNVDLILSRSKQIRFRVMDMGGRLIQDEGAPENYAESGRFTLSLDISGLQSGLYTLVMTDEEGAKLTKRFVKN